MSASFENERRQRKQKKDTSKIIKSSLIIGFSPLIELGEITSSTKDHLGDSSVSLHHDYLRPDVILYALPFAVHLKHENDVE